MKLLTFSACITNSAVHVHVVGIAVTIIYARFTLLVTNFIVTPMQILTCNTHKLQLESVCMKIMKSRETKRSHFTWLALFTAKLWFAHGPLVLCLIALYGKYRREQGQESEITEWQHLGRGILEEEEEDDEYEQQRSKRR